MLRIYLIMWFLCEILFSGKILADEKKCNYDFDLKEYPLSYQGKAIVQRPNIVYADSSEVMREKNMFYFHLSAGLIAYEMSAGYYLNPDTLLNVSFVYQKDAIFGISRLYSFTSTRFVADTLYFRGGPSYRSGQTVNYLNSLDKTDLGTIVTADFGIELAIGNRWQWRNLSIGGEWFAVYFPIIRNHQNDFDFQFRLLMMQLGISF